MSGNEPLRVEQVDIDQLRPDPGNPRVMRAAEFAALTRSIRKHGVVHPILVRREDRTVISGHQGLRAARLVGLSRVPVTWLDLSAADARVLNLAMNRIDGDWDQQMLARVLAELDADPGVDLTLTGFEEDQISALLRSLVVQERSERPETFDVDAALASATREPRTKSGDVWLLGDHRLLCGDATDANDIARVLSGRRPAMAFVDPPYNVDLGHHGGRKRGKARTMANDALDPAAWDRFLHGWAQPLVASVNGALYVCMSSKEWPTVAAVLAAEGGHWSDTIIWVKDRLVLGRADYQRRYEPIWYGWREGSTHRWCGDRDQTDVWDIDRPSEAPLHPVMKPLALMERAITNSSDSGELVLDPFAGSGSTIIACERTGRLCAAVEIDPVFVDVAVRRWERFTDAKARLADA